MIPTLLDDQKSGTSPATVRVSGGVEGEADLPREEASACAVCPHPLGGHDAIALRFCRATVDVGIDRGCVCRST